MSIALNPVFVDSKTRRVLPATERGSSRVK